MMFIISDGLLKPATRYYGFIGYSQDFPSVFHTVATNDASHLWRTCLRQCSCSASTVWWRGLWGLFVDHHSSLSLWLDKFTFKRFHCQIKCISARICCKIKQNGTSVDWNRWMQRLSVWLIFRLHWPSHYSFISEFSIVFQALSMLVSPNTMLLGWRGEFTHGKQTPHHRHRDWS